MAIQQIEVIKSWHITAMGAKIKPFYSIKITDDNTDSVLYPIYPFAEEEHQGQLREFVRLYEKELLDFYVNGVNIDFGVFVIKGEYENTRYFHDSSFDLSMADSFRERWFRKGVIFH